MEAQQSSFTEEEKKEIRKKSATMLMWIAIGSMIMLFAGLTSAYIVRQEQGHWLKFDLPKQFYFSTAVILLCSLTINWAYSSSKKGATGAVKTALWLTLLLATGFVILQFLGWGNLVDQKVFFAGKESNASGSFFYVLTGLHLAHLIGGYFYLLFVLVRASKNRYSKENNIDLKLCSIYWHFLDLLWIYLFLFLLFIR
jgi:cytochrome c oxidase subunit 3